MVVAEESSSIDFYAAVLMDEFGWLKSMTRYWGSFSRTHLLLGGATWPLAVQVQEQ